MREPGRHARRSAQNIQEAIALYVEDCRDAGDPVPTEAGKEFVEVEAA
jgi:predicted RNase H-like HicB family nuclease